MNYTEGPQPAWKRLRDIKNVTEAALEHGCELISARDIFHMSLPPEKEPTDVNWWRDCLATQYYRGLLGIRQPMGTSYNDMLMLAAMEQILIEPEEIDAEIAQAMVDEVNHMMRYKMTREDYVSYWKPEEVDAYEKFGVDILTLRDKVAALIEAGWPTYPDYDDLDP